MTFIVHSALNCQNCIKMLNKSKPNIYMYMRILYQNSFFVPKPQTKVCIPITFNQTLNNPNTPDTNCKSIFIIENSFF